VLPEPEILDANTIILLVCKRDVLTRTYGEKKEFKFTYTSKSYPTLPELLAQCRAHLSLESSERVSLTKYVPHLFEWKYLDPAEEISEK
jgi:hypothetical protein